MNSIRLFGFLVDSDKLLPVGNYREDNVIFVRLHDDESYGTTPEERFGAALDKMRKLIHGDGDKNACTKDQVLLLSIGIQPYLQVQRIC